MTALLLPRDVIDELRRRHAEFLRRRLTSEAAAREWRANLEGAWDAARARRVDELASEDAVARAVEAALAPEAVKGAGHPLRRAVLRALREEAGRDATKVGAYVPEAARKDVDALLERPGLVPEKLVRAVLEHEAMEEAMRDVLYDALRSFNETVNPFFAEWGLPGLVKRLVPIGSGAVLKSMEVVRAEFDKRLEPEMRKFLQGASKRALRKLADVLVRSSDDPKKGVLVRKAVAAWAYDQEVRAFAPPGDEAATERLHAIATAITLHVAEMPEQKARRAAAVRRFFAEHGALTLGEALDRHGIAARPDFDALAAATWPALKAALETAPVQAWLTALTDEFYAEVGA